jgi:hypothetical protein
MGFAPKTMYQYIRGRSSGFPDRILLPAPINDGSGQTGHDTIPKNWDRNYSCGGSSGLSKQLSTGFPIKHCTDKKTKINKTRRQKTV